jgi:hypothetical protein
MKHLLLLFSVVLVIFGCSSNNNGTVTVVPLAPTNLTGSTISTTQINLSWTDNATNEEGYKIERKTGSGSYAVVGSTATNLTTFSDLGLTPNTSYTYRVYANNSAGNSVQYSNELTIATQDPIPSWLTNGLVGYWPFNGNANDESGNGNNCNIQNGTRIDTDRNGSLNSSYYFDGVDDRMQTSSSFFNASNDFTISLWCKSSSLQQNQTILNTKPESILAISYNYYLNTQGDLKVLYGNGQSAGWYNSGAIFTPQTTLQNVWNNIILTKSNGVFSLYQNGIIVNSISITQNPASTLSKLNFGNCEPTTCGADVFNGYLDDIRIYNRALSASEVAYLATH